MSRTAGASVVSPNSYSLILSSPRLRQSILPEGLIRSPYEILDYRANLILHDPKGTKATFKRIQHIRFLQDGVSAILDHAWGDGVLVTGYHNSAGVLMGSFKDQGKRHLVIGLKQAMRKGEEVTFEVTREVMEGFPKAQEWLETTIDHPVRHMSCGVVFPRQRPCQQAAASYEGRKIALPVVQLTGGKTMLRLQMAQPRSHTPYKINWSW